MLQLKVIAFNRMVKVNGGRNLSNEYWEEFWEKKLDEMTKSKEKITQNSPENENIKTNQSEAEKSKKYIKQMDKWFRNAAIMGLVKINKISLQDLIGSNNENSSEKEKLEVLHETASNKHVMDDDKYVESVPLREDPEIYIHPLQMGIDKKKFKDIDFTPSRIGKKTIMTPQAYFIDATDDSSFEFVKRNDSTT
ncbi:uncharacterized protein LOC105423734 [Pogonomyrmex barbatus]|uniref:Uncharacterized protein LOC105423734 n=1 Tax=Pogonomyrmex barbatus TaxID=144034 RepID=A0A6I9VXV0_9HYME|nr:uncharacterized protein LOC105423734 [Pogonomyrmex barbatus]